MKDFKLATTYELQWIMNKYQYFENRYLQGAKRELDKRIRLRVIAQQRRRS